MGRKAKQYNADEARTVKAMAQYGVPHEDIAVHIGMSADILVKLYKAELAEGRAIANAKIGKRLFEKAMEGDVSALIFWAKCRMRWRTEDKRNGIEEPEEATPVSINVRVVDGRRMK